MCFRKKIWSLDFLFHIRIFSYFSFSIWWFCSTSIDAYYFFPATVWIPSDFYHYFIIPALVIFCNCSLDLCGGNERSLHNNYIILFYIFIFAIFWLNEKVLFLHAVLPQLDSGHYLNLSLLRYYSYNISTTAWIWLVVISASLGFFICQIACELMGVCIFTGFLLIIVLFIVFLKNLIH